MTYSELFYLKYKKGVSTHELVRRYPREADRVSEVALMDVPESILRDIIKEEETFDRLMRLKKRFLRFLS